MSVEAETKPSPELSVQARVAFVGGGRGHKLVPARSSHTHTSRRDQKVRGERKTTTTKRNGLISSISILRSMATQTDRMEGLAMEGRERTNY